MYRVRLDLEADAPLTFEDACYAVGESMDNCRRQPDHITVSIRHKKSGRYGLGEGDFWPQALLRAYEYREG